MHPRRLAEIDALFAEVLERPPEGRGAWLVARCGDDVPLRQAVEELLGLMESTASQEGSALDRAAAFLARLPENPSEGGLQPDDQVGPYTLVRRLAEGGMGVVFLAQRTDGTFERDVALKVLPGALTSTEAVQRFERERQILARLQHPNIAHLLDGGIDRRGLPYLVMEYVEGLPLDHYCDQQRLPVDERIRLLITIARAVQAAHRNLVVHRDLKPGNLLVTTDGEVKLLDFGIAKLIDPQVESLTLTLGSLPLTPSYASPEQVSGQAITTASDVYQLGLILYESLTGQRPQEAPTTSLMEMVQHICEHQPLPPSRAVLHAPGESSTEAAAARGSTPRRLAQRLRGDLDAIVDRALAKAPERRYASPEALATELERFLEGRPVRARRGSFLYRGGKWLRRNAPLAAVLALAALLTISYAITATLQARAIAEQRDRAQVEARKAAEVERFLVQLFEVADPGESQGRAVTAEQLLRRGTQRVALELVGQPEVQARMLSTLGQVHTQLGLYREAQNLHRQALTLRRDLFGEDHPEVAESHHRLGLALRKAGDYEAAEPHLRQAVALRRRVPGVSPDTFAESLLQLGYLHYFRGEYGAAEALFRENLAIQQRPQRPEGDADLVPRRGLAEALNALGLVEQDRGKGAEAEAYYRQALDLYRQMHGGLHHDVAIALYNIGRALQMQEDFAAAQPFFEESMAIEGDLLGEDHPEFARSMMITGNNLQILERLDEAEALFVRTQKIFEQRLEPTHPDRVTILQGFGQLRMAQGRLPEAEAFLRRAIDLRRELFGADHVQVALLYYPLSQCLTEQGRYKEALALCEEGLVMAAGKHALLEDQLTGGVEWLTARLAESD